MFGKADKAKRTPAHAQINSFMTALGSYKLDTGNFPTTEQGLQRAAREAGRRAINGPVRICRRTRRTDPWGHPYLYKYPGDHGDEPDIVSLGADGQPGGEGNNADIVSWSNK